MAYLFIGKTGVYIPKKKLQELQRQAAGRAVEFARSMFSEKAGTTVDDKIVRYLEALSAEDPRTFQREWISTRLFGQEAQEEAFWIIKDWSNYTGIGALVDFRNVEGQLYQSYSGEDISAPYGLYFGFEITAKTGLMQRPKRLVEIHWNLERVDSITGQFPSFRIYTADFDVQFDESVTVLPALHSEEETLDSEDELD
jgi:hypothetical protein